MSNMSEARPQVRFGPKIYFFSRGRAGVRGRGEFVSWGYYILGFIVTYPFSVAKSLSCDPLHLPPPPPNTHKHTPLERIRKLGLVGSVGELLHQKRSEFRHRSAFAIV